jgi:hypothetical protein
MYPRQRSLNRLGKSPVGSPELTLQQLGQGKTVGIVGGRERELLGQVQSPPVQIRFSMKPERKS